MDLVDIDKVLDDLELNEVDNNASSSKCISIVNENQQSASKNQMNLYENDESNEIEKAHKRFNAIDVYSIENQSSSSVKVNTTSSADSEKNQGKRFVAVSQVFSSLDDYCKDVESLEDGIKKCSSCNNNIINLKKSFEQNENEQEQERENENENDVDIDENDKNDDCDENIDNDDINITNYDEYENDPNNCIHSTEDIELDNDVDCVTSSSSITTSSSSSFSSGPSPRSTSESCSFISELSDKLGKGDVDKIAKNNKIKQPDMPNTYNIKEQEQNQIKGNDAKSDIINKDSKPCYNVDLPSSISSYLYKETTISACPELSQDLLQHDDLNPSFSISPTQKTNSEKIFHKSENNSSEPYNSFCQGSIAVSEDINVPDCDISQASSVNQQIVYFNNDSKKNENENMLQNETPPYQNVIKFGSTMDEISDTELDSILQDIDNELLKNTTVENDEDILEENRNNPSKIDAYRNQMVPNIASSEDITYTINVNSSNISLSTSRHTNDDDEHLQNADNFSQASTIEFTELPLQSDMGNLITVGAINNGDYSNRMKVKNEEKVKENENESFHEICTIPNETLSLGNANVQRPNTLELPMSNKNLTLEDLNSTAGQTPPASHVFNQNALLHSSPEDLSDHNSGFNCAGTNDEEGGNEIWENNTEITSTILSDNSTSSDASLSTNVNNENSQLGKIPPYWIPDSDANSCMQCKQKFSIIKRRHHCRACGQVLCSICCSQKAPLEFLGYTEVRVCVQCHRKLNQLGPSSEARAAIGENDNQESSSSNTQPIVLGRPPNPNNPMEYCSMIPPHEQVSQQDAQTPVVMVPVSVLKREGVPKNARKDKTVIFSDGIRPGCDLTDLDNNWDDVKIVRDVPTAALNNQQLLTTSDSVSRNKNLSGNNPGRSLSRKSLAPSNCENDSYIPENVNGLPPIYIKSSAFSDFEYKDVANNAHLIERLQTETFKFALQKNLYVFVKIVELKCCTNKTVINFTTFGMHHVGQDEIVILLEMNDYDKIMLPKDIFVHLNEVYNDADKGHPICELGFSKPQQAQNFLDSREHGGFLYIRPTFQCLQEINLPEPPFLIGILIHRWEVPWAKIFPLRLMLRLGAQYRYYPSPHISIRGRDSVYAEIAQTIINLLADFRNYSYTLATIKGMYIHMEDRKTSVLIPKNRYEQIVKALNNSSDHILALGGNFSKEADGHLVCIQNMKSDCPDTHTYSTQAINIQGQPRKVTGASFIVLNGALKSTSGLSGKCSIVEDGLMVQILPTKMCAIRNSLKNMKDVDIVCGVVDAEESQTEIVSLQWTENDVEFNIGVKSPIDSKNMDGVPSIRVHSGLNYSNTNYNIRWTEVFILQSGEESAHGKDPIDMSKLSEQIARSTSIALVPFLDLLVARGCVKLGLRATLHHENVCYEAGSISKLPPLYMKALDNELIPILHKQATLLEISKPIILELIFHILTK